jgi:uncharacterized protein (DUF2147 family)
MKLLFEYILNFFNPNKMKIAFTLLVAIIATTAMSFSNSTASSDADQIIGQYWSPDKDGKIEIFKSGSKYHGKLLWVKHPKKDTKNPDPALRNQDVIGLVFLKNFVFVDGKYTQGTVYNSLNGHSYSCQMWLEEGNLKMRGFVGISLLGRTETFEKIR